MKRKKYGNGGTIDRSYIADPQTVLAQNDINIAKAMQAGQNSNLALGLDIASQAVNMYGSPLIDKFKPKMANGGTVSVKGDESQFANIMAFGGFAGYAPVNIESKEYVQTPQGISGKVEGNQSHEKGGINTELPVGTKIYSDRIRVNGESMADRAMKRDKQVSSLEKYIGKHKTGSTIEKTTLDRMKFVNQKQELKDLELQKFVKGAEQIGAAVNTFAGGTGIEGILPEGLVALNKEKESNPFSLIDRTGYSSIPTEIPTNYNNINTPIQDIVGSRVYSNSESPIMPVQGAMNTEIIPNYLRPRVTSNLRNPIKTTELPRTPSTISAKAKPVDDSNPQLSFLDKIQQGLSSDNKELKENYTPGDIMGLVGSAYSSIAPMRNTLAARASDQPNINPYVGYGDEAMKTLDASMAYAGQQKDAAMMDLERGRSSATANLQANARGINTQRAGELAIYSDMRDKELDVNATFANQMMQLLGQKAQTQLGIDQVKSQRILQQDLANRQDKDNFYTQLGRDKESLGLGMQQFGRNLNQAKYRQDTLTDIQAIKDLKITLNADSDTLGYLVKQYNLSNANVENLKKFTNLDMDYSELDETEKKVVNSMRKKNNKG